MIVGITGYKGSGKDTAASVFVGAGWAHVKFADGLKEMLRALLALQGVDEWLIERMIDGDLKEVPSAYLSGRTPRYAMQTLGTEWGRDFIGSEFWTGVTEKAVMAALDAGAPGVVISDMRFPNECNWINQNGRSVRVVREGKTSDDPHPSEAMVAALPVHHEVFNNGKDLVEFKSRVKELFQAGE